MKIRNPRTGAYDYELKCDSAAEVQSKAASLRKHQQAWKGLSLEQRIAIMQQFAHSLADHKQALFDALSVDTGRRKITEIEIDGTIGMIHGKCASIALF